MSEIQPTSYDDVPYESKPLYPTHPDCLATVAALFGLRPAHPAQCRVLELGCAGGGNLIPMADLLPESQFVGIDLSPSQIADGQQVVDALGLKNIELRALSILDVDDSLGPFDYIICHGVYSWVPKVVQDKILDICRRHLTPQGVAYISYNTYPGWHARGMVREMINFHTRQFDEPGVKVGQARAFLDFLVRATGEQAGPYAKLLAQEANLLKPSPDYYLFHEHLEDVNQPLYFHEFADRLAAHELQYVAESWFHTNPADFPPEVQEVLQGISADLVHFEQYIDFLTNRTFRRSVICRGDVPLNRAPADEAILRLRASALAQPVGDNREVASTAPLTFRADEGQTVTTNLPLVKAALLTLFDAWPGSISFDELAAGIERRLPGIAVDAQAQELLVATLLQCFLSHTVALHVLGPRPVLEPRERPLARPLARYQAAHELSLANLRHRVVRLGPGDRLVLAHLDGRRDRAALIEVVRRAVCEQGLELEYFAEGASQAANPAALGEWLEGSLRRIARSALVSG